MARGDEVPEWLERRDELGPMHVAAIRFVQKRGATAALLGRGAPTLAWLARQIDEFAAREVGPREEAEFLEGAGSLLAAVLVDHVGLGAHVEREGVHRLRLGTHGTFDPFAAIEHSLDASSARAALVAEVAKAEAEASARGGIGRVLKVFERVLADRRPDLGIEERFDGRVWLNMLEPDSGTYDLSDPASGAIEVDLGRVVEVAEGQSEQAVEVAVKKLIDMFPGGVSQGISLAEAHERLLPRVVGAGFDLRGSLFCRALPNGARLCLVLAYDGRARFVRRSEIDAWDCGEDEAVRIALQNLARRSTRARFSRSEAFDGPIVQARTGDGLDSARLVLPGLVDVLGGELGEPFIAAVPHRDVLLACRVDSPVSLREMMERVADDYARAPHRISDKPFLVDRGGLRPL